MGPANTSRTPVKGQLLQIEKDDLSRDAVRALVAEHLTDMHTTSPPESAHALDLTGLTQPSVTVWTL